MNPATRRIEISKVVDAASWADVMRLRKEVFLDEMGYCQQSLDRERGVLRLANRQCGTYLARYHGLPVGTIAIDWWRGLDVAHPDVRHLQMQLFAAEYGSQSLFTVRKWLVKAPFRKTRVASAMIHAVAGMAAQCKVVEFVVIDCDPSRVDSFAVLGFRRFGQTFRYPADLALSVPMCFVARDLDYLQRQSPPIHRLMVELGLQHDPEVAAFFARVAGRPGSTPLPPDPVRR